MPTNSNTHQYGIGIVTSLVLGTMLEVGCPTLGCLTSAD